MDIWLPVAWLIMLYVSNMARSSVLHIILRPDRDDVILSEKTGCVVFSSALLQPPGRSHLDVVFYVRSWVD